MRNRTLTVAAFISVALFAVSCNSDTNTAFHPSGFEELDRWAEQCKTDSPNALGYPANYTDILINNAGDPFEEAGILSSAAFEREVMEFFAPSV